MSEGEAENGERRVGQYYYLRVRGVTHLARKGRVGGSILLSQSEGGHSPGAQGKGGWVNIIVSE